MACGDGSGGGETTSTTTGTTSTGIAAPQATDPVAINDIRGSKVVEDGCSVEIGFVWRPDESSGVMPNAKALIRVNGPGVEGTYSRPVSSGAIKLTLSTAVERAGISWRAKVLSIGDRPVRSQLPNTLHFQNLECGAEAPGPTTPSSDLPNVPVPGAPCVPGQTLPHGLECK